MVVEAQFLNDMVFGPSGLDKAVEVGPPLRPLENSASCCNVRPSVPPPTAVYHVCFTLLRGAICGLATIAACCTFAFISLKTLSNHVSVRPVVLQPSLSQYVVLQAPLYDFTSLNHSTGCYIASCHIVPCVLWCVLERYPTDIVFSLSHHTMLPYSVSCDVLCFCFSTMKR